MRWHTYHIGPIDFSWQHLKTVSDTASEMGSAEAQSKAKGLGHVGGPDVADFIAAWESAQEAAKEKGWEGDFRNEPAVFWLPAADEFVFGFVIKQDNNGSTFVISPYPLPWVAAEE